MRQRASARIVAAPQGDIAIFRTADDEVFALDDRCPHKGGPLSQGLIYGKRVACPLPQPASQQRPGDGATAAIQSNSAGGYSGRACAYCAATAEKWSGKLMARPGAAA